MIKTFSKHKKSISSILLAVILLLSFSVGETVYAEESLNKDGNANYTIDTVPDDAVEDEGWISKIGSSISDGVKWGVSKIPLMGWVDDFNVSEILPTVLNFFVDVIFKLNMLLTNGLTLILEMSFDFNVVNVLLEEVEGKVQDISGIDSSGLIKDTGMFGTFGLIIVIITVIYAVFIVLFKRSMLSSFSVMLQTVVVITLAILLFTNFSFYMTGANKLTTQASSLILGGNSASYDITKEDDEQDESANDLKTGMKDNIWSMFVDRPYMYMMFGEINYSKLDPNGDDAKKGRQRVEAVTLKTGEERYEALVSDIKNYQNTKPLHSSVSERIAFTPLYFGINALVSIPILLLSLAMILFQFWFLIIAVFAPFVFIIAAIPGQIGVLKQFGKELMIPLLLKMALSFFMLIFFVFSDVLYNLNDKIAEFAGSDSTITTILTLRPDMYLILVGALNLMVFASVLLLSRRIFGIFSASPLGETALSPINSGVQSTASLVGAGVGAVAGGAPGAMAGASLGGSVGKAATGEGSVSDVATSAMRAKYMTNLSNLGDGNDIDGESGEDNKTPINETSDSGVDIDDGGGKNPPNSYADLEKCPKCNETPCVCNDDDSGGSDNNKCPRCHQNPCVCNDGDGPSGGSSRLSNTNNPTSGESSQLSNLNNSTSDYSGNTPTSDKNENFNLDNVENDGIGKKQNSNHPPISGFSSNEVSNTDDNFQSQVDSMPSLDFGGQDNTPEQNIEPNTNFITPSPLDNSSDSPTESSSNWRDQSNTTKGFSDWGSQQQPTEESNEPSNQKSVFGFGSDDNIKQNKEEPITFKESNDSNPEPLNTEDHHMDRE